MDFTRTDTTFESGDGVCVGWYYEPGRAGGSAGIPIVVMAHGFAGVRALRLDAYAERFAAAGYRVLLFDYRFFGDSPGEPRQVLDIDAQLVDWRAAISHARSLSAGGREEVVLWGTSLGGGHVLTTAATDHNLAAVIAQVPHVSGVAAARSVGSLMSLRLAALSLRDMGRSALGRKPLYIPAAGAPGEVAAMTSPDAAPGMRRLIEQSDLGRDIDPAEFLVSARVILRLARYSPGRGMGSIECPVLVQIADRDAITPTAVAVRAAASLRHPTIHHYDLEHFDPYVEPHFKKIIEDQVDFLREVVPL